MPSQASPLLGPRFQEALAYSAELHAFQKRKGGQIPYVAHLLAVCALVLEDGGDEDEAIAALLHDAVEDQGGEATLTEIRTRFGERVASIVDGCSDTDVLPKPPWRARKEQYIEHVQCAPREVLRVSCADKLHNTQSILRDLRRIGDALWSRFSVGREESLWYYRTLCRIFQECGVGEMAEELARTLDEIDRLPPQSEPTLAGSL